jgi:hypothetical protein
MPVMSRPGAPGRAEPALVAAPGRDAAITAVVVALTACAFAAAGGHRTLASIQRLDDAWLRLMITGNVPSADTEFSGGILVASGPGDPATAPSGNRVHGNRILRNDPDLFWDQTGAGNSFRGNLCQTSTPAGLCHQ